MSFYSLKHALNPEKIDAAVDAVFAVGADYDGAAALAAMQDDVTALEGSVSDLQSFTGTLVDLTVEEGTQLNGILVQLLALYDPDTHELTLDNGTVKVTVKA
jgi:hypothetical protein